MAMANTCESVQGSLRDNKPKGLLGLNQQVRWQESRPNDRGSRLSTTRAICGCLRPWTPEAELVNPVASPLWARVRSSLPSVGRLESFRLESSPTGKPTVREVYGAARQDAGRSECRSVMDRIRVRDLLGAKASPRPAGIPSRDHLENRPHGGMAMDDLAQAMVGAPPRSPRAVRWLQVRIAKAVQEPTLNIRVEPNSAFGMLERSAVKVARSVLRGAGVGNGPLPTRLRTANRSKPVP